MSQEDPKHSQPATVETLEDAVYRSSLSENNSALKGTNPLIAIPTTIATYICVALLIFFVATKTEAGKQALEKTAKILLDDEEEDDDDKMEDLPPPPPAPAAPIAAPLREEISNAPPPPPMTDQDMVPDEAPKVVPDRDYSTAFGSTDADVSNAGGIGGVPGGTGGGGIGAMGGAIGGTASIHDFDYKDIVVRLKPPQPPYPALAKASRQSGSVSVEITIGTDGVPESAKVVAGGPAFFHKYATDYAMKWRFEPALMEGQPTKAKFILKLNFKL